MIHQYIHSLKNTRLVLCAMFVMLNWMMNAQKNEAARYEIDAKRIGVNPTDKDALPRSREFIRLDSTYYVGWMYEGLYKYERSSDYMGYKYAIAPLQKALYLIEKDYGTKLENIFTSFNYFNQYGNRFNDFYAIVYTLELCYNSIEMPDSTMALFNKMEAYNFQRDFFNIGCVRSWLYHRNRFYTSEKHPFLKNSIKENEVLAFDECYKQIGFIKKNKAINDYWYGPSQSEEDLLTVYHYLALLHDYNQNYDSSQYYYQLLIDGGRISWSNYANMHHEVGNFAEAIKNYSKQQYKRKFSLSESSYYMPMLLVYSGLTKDAINLAQNQITESGSTPGFGWYNITLARSYLYDGQLDSCDFFLTKASNFKELHINTTLTQSQYEFTINLLRIQLIDKKIALTKFFNTGWWYSISDIYNIYALKSEKLMLEYALVNALANNPERSRIVYDLFCSETTVSFDESMYLLKDFCLPYFERKYNNYVLTDKRSKIIRYFKLFATKFVLESGEINRAKIEAEELLSATVPIGKTNQAPENLIDVSHERLYTYRLLEILAQASEETERYDVYRNKCFAVYPQLMPFSGIPAKMGINFSGLENDELIQKVFDDLKECNIEITNNPSFPQAQINFDKKGDTYMVVINVWDENNKTIVENGTLLFKQNEGVGKELALRLFGKGGSIKFERPIN